MRILGAVGLSNSGKTTVLTVLTRHLKGMLGLSVFVAKDIHKSGVRFDTPGKDTHEYRDAGADFVLGRAEGDAAIFIDPSTSLDEIVDIARSLGVDVLVLEGFKQEQQERNLPRVLCLKSASEVDDWDLDGVICISGVAASTGDLGTTHSGLPVFDALGDPARLVEFVTGKLDLRK
ncbi:MAG: molybdopterin-guanine dinucleotide biosynthesis protein B [Promethearchaeota archaeon]